MKTLLIMFFLVIVFCTTVVKAQTQELDKAKAEIAELLQNKIAFYEGDVTSNLHRLASPSKILVLDDRIEMTIKKNVRTVYYTDILDNPFGTNYVKLGNTTFIEFKNGNARKLGDNLKYIQNQLNEKRFTSQLALFKPLAAQYCALKVKPPIVEEQRKYIVQANSFSEQKMYDKAIELYIKAIEVDQTAYPTAYSNLALLTAQVGKIDAAIYYMKKYLLLEPVASDARNAQDKIYVWEAKLGK